MESFRQPENSGEREPITRELVIALMKEKGFEESRALRTEWAKQQEEQYEKQNSLESNILMAIDMALLYEETGNTDLALEDLNDARDMAYAMNLQELQATIEEHLERVKRS